MPGKKRSGLANDRRAYVYTNCLSQTQSTITYMVTYNGNGSGSGNTPDDSSSYRTGSDVTVLGNTGSLTKQQYEFDGWNTQSDGNGTNYLENNNFTITANTILYAKWVPTYTVTYDGNGNGSGTPPPDSSQYRTGSDVTVLGNTGSLTRTDYIFDGWNTNQNGSGITYLGNITFTISNNMILYAKWKK
jgi:uncharacterized repeat protein (TIGR02543 family)